MIDVAILIVWVAFWLGWLASAFAAKRTIARPRTARRIAIGIIVVGFVLVRSLASGGWNRAAVHSSALDAVGIALLLGGLGIAVWARVSLGRNWGMPMSQKDSPELVSSGPYAVVRHPIYSGIVLATVGTALAVNLEWLGAAAVMFVYFTYSATVEERMLSEQFPETYPGYRARTKMLIPFLF